VVQILSQILSLRRINLSENFVNGKLPEAIGSLTQLEELRLDLNQVSVLPASIGQLLSLRVLTLSDNSLVALPQEMSSLVNIQVAITIMHFLFLLI
jgi:Leucine-rich repeat (LRR) protein